MAKKTSTMESFFREGNDFGELLPYFSYEEGVFVLKDGSLGQIWEFSLIEADAKDNSYLKHMANNIEGLLTRLPEEIVSCQLILVTDQDLREKINMYTAAGSNEMADVVETCRKEKIKHINEGKSGFFEQHTGPFCAKQIRGFFTMRFFPEWAGAKWMDKATHYFTGEQAIKERLAGEFQKNKQYFERYCDTVEGVLKGCEIKYKRVDEEILFSLLYKLLNPKRYKNLPIPVFRKDEYLTEQILYNAPLAGSDGFTFENCKVRVISLKELPIETETGMFTAEMVRGTRFSMLDMLKNFVMVINFHIPQQEEAIKKIKAQKAFAFVQRFTLFGDKSVEAAEQKEELDSVIRETFSSGHKIVYPRIQFIVYEDSEDASERAINNILNVLNRMGCEGLYEEIIGAALFISCLPLCFNHSYERMVKRTKRMISNNLSDMLPIYGSTRGTDTPAQVYLNRRGEPIFLDFFDSNTNPHAIVLGSSGGGKSFFINDMIMQTARMDAHFFVLDKGDSYRKLCRILGGKYIRFEFNEPVTINPFMHHPDPEHLAFLVTLLSEMCSGGDERDRLNREQEGVLQKAVISAYEKKQNTPTEVVLSDVADELKGKSCNADLGVNENIGVKLALKLTPFTKDGSYGKFFDGKNRFSLDSRFTVFELGNLSSHADLQMVVLLNIMYFITSFVSLPNMKPKRKYLLIDEAWSLLRLKNTSEFITNSFKTYRKYRCSVVAITQEVVDLIGKDCGIAIQANAANKVFLRQEPQVVDSLKGFASLSDKDVELLKSIETQKGKYSEAMVITDSTRGIIRLVPDPFLYWVATSDAKDNEFLEKKITEKAGNIMEAVEACVKENKYGLH